VFFTLFGAVALVGVIGAATATLMRGPVGTMVALNEKAKVDTQEQIAGKLSMLEAAQQANNGDCDADGYVEPVPPDLTCAHHPLGASSGCIPSAIGSAKSDPWGTAYGYWAWNHGPMTSGGACSTDLYAGVNAGDKPVIAIISAGPDRTFQTSCAAGTYVTTPAGSDDVVLSYTYAEAVQVSGGLWSLKSGAPNTATIDKNIDVSGTAHFQSGITGDTSFGGGNFDFKQASGMFPPNTASAACTPSNQGSLGVTFSSGQILQICDPGAPASPQNHSGWVDIGGATAGTSVAGGNKDIQFNDNGSFGGSSSLTWDKAAGKLTTAKLDATGDVSLGAKLGVTGDTSLGGKLGVTGDTVLGGAVESDGKLTAKDDVQVDKNLNVTLNAEVRGNTNLDGTLDVTDLSTLTGGAAVKNGSAAAPGLSFLGSASTGVYFSSGGGLGLSVGGVNHANVTSTGLAVTSDATATGNVVATGTVAGDALVVGAVGSGVGVFSDAAAGMEFRTANTTRMLIDAGGDIGIHLAGAPSAALDISGLMRLRDTGMIAGGFCGAIGGALSYSSADALLVCSSTTGKWETIGTSGGGGSGAADFWTQLGDKRLYYGLGDVGIGTNDPLTRLHVNGGDLLVKGTYTGTAASPVSGAGALMLFDVPSGSFRAGSVNGAQWDSGNIGANSVAMGTNTQAGGASSVAMGNTANASNAGSVAIGSTPTSSGINSIAMGRSASATGDYSMALGLGSPAGVAPVVSGSKSFGVFMGDQSAVNLADPNIMGLFGGKLVVDPNVPATMLTTNNSLAVDVNGDVGAVNYCDEAGLHCFAATDIAGGNAAAPGNDREILFNSHSKLGADANLVFSSTGRLGIGTATPTTRLDVNGSIRFAYGGEACDAPRLGGMYFSSSTHLLYGCLTAGAWTPISTGSTAGAAAGTDRQMQFNSAGSLAGADNITYSSVGIFNSTRRIVVGGSGVDTNSVFVTGGNATSTGNANTAIGVRAGAANTGGDSNVYIGADAGMSNATGFQNVLIGAAAGRSQTGSGNTVIGENALYYGKGGTSNTIVGVSAAQYVSGLNNLILGAGAGNVLKGGNSNILIGYGVDVPGAATSNYLNIGNTIYGTHLGGGSARIGVRQATPATALDVNGTLKIAYGGEDCGATTYGGVYYSSATHLLFACLNGSAWTQIGTAGSVTAAGANAQIQFNSNGNLGASPSFVWDGANKRLGVDTSAPTHAFSVAGPQTAQADFFYDNAAVGAGKDGQHVAIWRRDASDDASMQMYIDQYREGYLLGDDNISHLHILTTATNSEINLQDWAVGDVDIFNQAVSGQTPTLNISGFRSGDAQRTLSIGVGQDAANTATFTGVGKYYFNGSIGVGQKAPATKLDVNGTLKIAYGNEACGAATYGGVYYSSATHLLYACLNGASWTQIGTAGAVTAAGANTQVQFNSGGSLGASSSFVWDKTNKRLGIGTTAPDDRLQIQMDDENSGLTIVNATSSTDRYPGFAVYNYSGGFWGTPQLALFNSRGSEASPAAVRDGDFLGFLAGYGQYDTGVGNFGKGAQVHFIASGDFSSTSYPTDIVFQTVASGSRTMRDRMRITSSGRVGVNVSSPVTMLSVDGTIQMAYSGEPCDAAHVGSLYYSSTTELFYGCSKAGSWTQFTLGSSGSAAGSNTNVQFNSAGAFAGSGNFTWNNATGTMTVTAVGTNAEGVVGIITAGNGDAIKGQSSSTADSSPAVWAHATGATGVTNGLSADNNSSSGYAGKFSSFAVSGTTYGVYSSVNSPSGYVFYGSGTKSYFGGKVGIGQTAPATALDVNGTLRIAYGGEACDGGHLGGLYYNSADSKFYGCLTAGGWTQMASGAINSNLGASKTATNPSVSGDATSGFYTPGASSVAVSAGGAQIMGWGAAAGAVNYVSVTPAATGAGPVLASAGPDTNIDLNLTARGTGAVSVTNATGVKLAGATGAASPVMPGVLAGGSSTQVQFNSNGGLAGSSGLIWTGTQLGIGAPSPQAMVDVNGTIRVAYGGEACDSAHLGGLYYSSASAKFFGCLTAGSWTQIASGAMGSNLGTSTAATNPSVSGDATTGFYTPGVSTVAVSAGGKRVTAWGTVASAVNYLSATPAATGAGAALAAAGTDANIDLNLTSKGTGMVSLTNSSGLKIAGVSGAPAPATVGSGSSNLGTSTSAANPAISGDETSGFYTPAASTVAVTAGGKQAMQWNNAANAVNYLNVTPAATPAGPALAAAGSDTNIT